MASAPASTHKMWGLRQKERHSVLLVVRLEPLNSAPRAWIGAFSDATATSETVLTGHIYTATNPISSVAAVAKNSEAYDIGPVSQRRLIAITTPKSRTVASVTAMQRRRNPVIPCKPRCWRSHGAGRESGFLPAGPPCGRVHPASLIRGH